MDVNQFIQNAISGNASEAKENINDILSTRAFQYLDEYKKQIAQKLYATEDEVEVQDTADTPVEDEELLTQEEFDSLSEEDQELYLESLEQIDELSKGTLGRYVQKRVKQIPNIEVNYQMTPDDDGPMGAKRIRKFQKKINKGVTGALNRLSGTDVNKKPAKTKTNEEVEQIDELSNDSYKNYISSSKKEVNKHMSGSQLSRYGDSAGPKQDRELNTKNAQKFAKKKLMGRLHADLDRMP
jgi:hypothetical protein